MRAPWRRAGALKVRTRPTSLKNIPQASGEFLHISEVQKGYLAEIHCTWGIRTRMKT